MFIRIFFCVLFWELDNWKLTSNNGMEASWSRTRFTLKKGPVDHSSTATRLAQVSISLIEKSKTKLYATVFQCHCCWPDIKVYGNIFYSNRLHLTPSSTPGRNTGWRNRIFSEFASRADGHAVVFPRITRRPFWTRLWSVSSNRVAFSTAWEWPAGRPLLAPARIWKRSPSTWSRRSLLPTGPSPIRSCSVWTPRRCRAKAVSGSPRPAASAWRSCLPLSAPVSAPPTYPIPRSTGTPSSRRPSAHSPW